MQKNINAETVSSFEQRMLRLIPTFPSTAIRRLEAASAHRQYEPGQVILQEGDPGGGIFVLITGAVERRVSVSSGARIPIMLPNVSALSCLSRNSIMHAWGAFSLTISAYTTTDAMFIPQAALLSVLREFPQAGIALSQLLSEELAQTYARIVQLRSNSSSTRRSLSFLN